MRSYLLLVAFLSISEAFLGGSRGGHPSVSPLRSATTAEAVGTTVATPGALSLSVDELAPLLGGRGRARLAWDCYSIGVDPHWYFSQPETDPAIQNELPTCRQRQRLGAEALRKLLDVNGGRPVQDGIVKLVHRSVSSDFTTKLLLQLADGLTVETVIIPWNGSRSTLCVSSQVGCRQACRFCATGRMGKLRNLTSDEILAQLFYAVQQCRVYEYLPPISNIVFMGMGEPADNAENVKKATEIMTTRELFQLSATRVTVSTVAPDPGAFKSFGDNCVLAWSVHAARDDLRRQLVPTTKFAMAELRQGLIDALLERPHNFRTTMLEVALMAGVNDSEREADELASFAQAIPDSVPGCKLVVNLIPFNDIGHDLYEKPSPEAVLAFQKRLWSKGIYAHVRTTRGDDESAACGQLATKKAAIQP